MKRNEYRLLVENWNSYLVKEEKRMLNEKLLIESFLLNEFNIKKFATNLKNKLNNPYVSVPALVLFLAAKSANATPLEIAKDPSRIPGNNSQVSQFFDGSSESDLEEYTACANVLDGSITAEKENELVTTIFYSTGSGGGSGSGTIQSGEILGRTISSEEQNVINLLKLFDNNPEAFKEAIKDVKNQALLCSFGYCYGEWKEDGKNKYELYSPLGYTFMEMTGDSYATGVDPIPKGKAVEIHTKNNNPPKDDYIKKLRSQYRPLLSNKSAKAQAFGKSLNQLDIMYQLSWKAALDGKIKEASKSMPDLIATFKRARDSKDFKGDLVTSFEDCVEKNEIAFIKGLKKSYLDSISILSESGRLTQKSAREISENLDSIEEISDIGKLEDINEDIVSGFLINIFGTADRVEVRKQLEEES
jgi:hypothetical protein